MRFNHPGDLATSLGMNVQSVWKAPEYNTGGVTNILKTIVGPSIGNIKNTVDAMKPENADPMSLHTMSGYSEPSKPMDFIKSTIEGYSAYNKNAESTINKLINFICFFNFVYLISTIGNNIIVTPTQKGTSQQF